MRYLSVFILSILISCCAVPSIVLNCSNIAEYCIESSIDVKSFPLTQYGLKSSCLCAYDANGACRRSPYLCNASNVTYGCSFKLKNFVISREGGLFQRGTDRQVVFSDPTMSGPHGPVYYKKSYEDWNSVIHKIRENYMAYRLNKTYDIVVPLRMQWDDCFNHMSFQTLPLVGAVREFHSDLWDKLTWHCSLYSAAIMRSLGVPDDRIVIEAQIQARTVLLPWIPHWLPVKLASVYGISGRVCTELTNSLLNWKFPSSAAYLEHIAIHSPSHPNSSASALINPSTSEDKHFRYIVYVSRSGQDSRDVHKEVELLESLSSIINKDQYKLVVVGHSNAYKTVERLQRSWQRFAQIFSRAIVMIGPHGGAWNNLIFTPSDCHYIEFNYLPTVPVFIGGAPIRSPFLNAHWAKGGSGRFYIIEANNRSSWEPPNFYFDKRARISVREVVQVMLLIDKHIHSASGSGNHSSHSGLLRPGVRSEDFPHNPYLEVRTAAPRPAPTKRPTVTSAATTSATAGNTDRLGRQAQVHAGRSTAYNRPKIASH